MPNPDTNLPPSETVAGEGDRPKQARRAVANVEGFLAWVMMALLVGFIRALRRPTGDFLVEGNVILLLYSSSWLFAISGARRGRGAARIAAITALGVLATTAVLFVLVPYIAADTRPPAP